MLKFVKLNKICIYFLTKILNNLVWFEYIIILYNNVVYSICSIIYLIVIESFM